MSNNPYPDVDMRKPDGTIETLPVNVAFRNKINHGWEPADTWALLALQDYELAPNPFDPNSGDTPVVKWGE